MRKASILFLFSLSLYLLNLPALAQEALEKSKGQTVYVGAAYNDYSYNKVVDDVTITVNQTTSSRVVIRNVDPDNEITVTSVRFYNPNGQLVKEFLSLPEIIGGWGSKTYLASGSTLGVWPPYNSSDRPFFIVEWESGKQVIAPLIGACVTASRPDGNFIEFLGISNTRGRVIREKGGSEK